MTYNLVCDSSCDLKSAELLPGRLKLTVIPMQISAGGREYPDDETLNVAALLSAMQEGPSGTACPSPAAFAEAFAAADCSFCFTISSNLSGTYNAALLGREMALEEHPEKKICVIDSRSTAGILVLLVQKTRALLNAESEPDFEALSNALTLYRDSLRTVFTLECYDNLIRNGRMHPLVGNLLHTLGIHVVAEASEQGTIRVSGKHRGEVKTFAAIVERMSLLKDCTGAEVWLAHCENLPGALRLKELITRELPVKSVSILPCRGLTTYYAMRGGLIVGF